VPDLTFGPKMVADLRRATRLPLDVHLMILAPDRWIERYVEAGAAYLTVHVETTADPAATRAALDSAGSTAELVVDGGVKTDNCVAVRDAGASVLVAGSAVYLDPEGPAAAIARFRKVLA